MKRTAAALSLLVLCWTQGFGRSNEAIYLRIGNQYGNIEGALYLPKQPTKIAIVHAHPWGNELAGFPNAELAEKGFAVLGFNTHAVNKDDLGPDATIEPLMLDVAAAVQEMKDRGYEKVFLMGGSAGGPLMSLYQNVAENGNAVFAGEKKLYKFLGFFEKDGKTPRRLPKGEGLIFRNPICGLATTFLNRLDPSITDEVKVKRDPALDLYNLANGYDPKTETASYSKAFIDKFEHAQAARMNRLIDTVLTGQTLTKSGEGPYSDGGIILVPGTRARLMYTDMHLGNGVGKYLILPENVVDVPKHDRAPGHYSLFGDTPDRNNSVEGVMIHTYNSFLSAHAIRATYINPQATHLSEWGVDVESTNSTTVGNMVHVSAPWILFAGTADDKINVAELIYNEAKSKDKKIIILRGATHPIASVDPKRFLDTKGLREIMVAEIVKWIKDRS